jgi:hypothetical protein
MGSVFAPNFRTDRWLRNYISITYQKMMTCNPELSYCTINYVYTLTEYWALQTWGYP